MGSLEEPWRQLKQSSPFKVKLIIGQVQSTPVIVDTLGPRFVVRNSGMREDFSPVEGKIGSHI